MLPIYRNYKQDKDFEERSRNRFNALYKTYFRGLNKIEVINNQELQYKGHDVHLHFNNGNVEIIDEKVRRVDYDDILIEYLSNKESGRKGWIYDSESTLLAYLFPTKGIWFLYAQKIKEWVKDINSYFWSLKTIESINQKPDGTKYTTVCKAVPLSIMERMGFVFGKILQIKGLRH